MATPKFNPNALAALNTPQAIAEQQQRFQRESDIYNRMYYGIMSPGTTPTHPPPPAAVVAPTNPIAHTTNLSYYNEFQPQDDVADAYTYSGFGSMPMTGFVGAGSWYNAGVV
jgi:hypothetical protein